MLFTHLLTKPQRENINIDWLLTGEGEMKKEGYPIPEEKGLTAAEKPAIYNVREDPELEEIIRLLIEHPQDKRLVLKFPKIKKDMGESFRGIEIKNLLTEEG